MTHTVEKGLPHADCDPLRHSVHGMNVPSIACPACQRHAADYDAIERWADDHFTQGEVAVVMRLVVEFGWRPPSVLPPADGGTDG